MKSSKEFFERLQTDETFVKEIGEKVRAKADAGVTDYKEIWIPLAAEYGYELTGEELDDLNDKVAGEVTEEELGKVAGGSTPVCVGTVVISITGSVLWTISITNSSEIKAEDLG